MKNIKIVLVACLALLMIVTFCACGNSNKGDANSPLSPDITSPETTDLPYGAGDHSSNDAHYLDFYVDGTRVARMLVTEEDTYESLVAFFPIVPEKEGHEGTWEFSSSEFKRKQTVYSKTEKIIKLKATYYIE